MKLIATLGEWRYKKTAVRHPGDQTPSDREDESGKRPPHYPRTQNRNRTSFLPRLAPVHHTAFGFRLPFFAAVLS